MERRNNKWQPPRLPQFTATATSTATSTAAISDLHPNILHKLDLSRKKTCRPLLSKMIRSQKTRVRIKKNPKGAAAYPSPFSWLASDLELTWFGKEWWIIIPSMQEDGSSEAMILKALMMMNTIFNPAMLGMKCEYFSCCALAVQLCYSSNDCEL